MSRFFIHIRDRDKFFVDSEGIEAESPEQIQPHIEQTVRDIVGDEGGWTLDDPRAVEVADQTGHVVLAIPFRAIIVPH